MRIGARIKSAREQKHLTQEELGIKCGTTKQTIFKYESGVVTNIPMNRLEQIAEALEVSPASLMGWEEPTPSGVHPMPSTRLVPRLGSIACGVPILAEQNIEDYDTVPDWVKCDFTLVCRGDSMINARIFDGDIVCVKQQEQAENGEIAVVLVDGEFDSEATLKRVRLFNDHISLEAENPQYRPFVYWGEDMNKVHVIGKATHFISSVK